MKSEENILELYDDCLEVMNNLENLFNDNPELTKELNESMGESFAELRFMNNGLKEYYERVVKKIKSGDKSLEEEIMPQ